jgi:trans-2,3-dihydro-3-hydroxyanthranilate isomerase
MHVVIAWWDLSDSAQTVDSLRGYLREESVDAFAQVAGLRLKLWIADRAAHRWGVVMLWENAQAAKAPLPTRAAALIGYPATSRWSFDLEAAVEGQFEYAALSRIGLAFAGEEDAGKTGIPGSGASVAC